MNTWDKLMRRGARLAQTGTRAGHLSLRLSPLCCWLRFWQGHLMSQPPGVLLAEITQQRSPPLCRCDALASGTNQRSIGDAVSGELSSAPLQWVIYDSPAAFPKQRVLIAAARLGKTWRLRKHLAVAMGHYFRTLSPQASLIVTGEGMSCHDLCLHSTSWFGLPLLKLFFQAPTLASRDQTARWLDRVEQDLLGLPAALPAHVMRHYAWISPGLPIANDAGPAPWGDRAVGRDCFQNVDQVAFAISNHLRLIHLKPNSQTLQVTGQWLSTHAGDRSHQAFVYVPPIDENDDERRLNVSHKKVARELMSRGVAGWYVSGGQPAADESIVDENVADKNVVQGSAKDEAASDLPSLDVASNIALFQAGDAEGFLAHHTRAMESQWPEETAEEYWSEWLFGHHSDSGPMATLLRILAQRRLRASGKLIPGQIPVVCFSARCPTATVAQRQFRSHLGRWDYEPFGIAIRHARLQAYGAKPVRYVSASEPEAFTKPVAKPVAKSQQPFLAKAATDSALENALLERAFEQVKYTTSKTGTPKIDWSLEQEYRMVGDVDLRQFSSDDYFVFVPDRTTAQIAATLTTARVLYLSDNP